VWHRSGFELTADFAGLVLGTVDVHMQLAALEIALDALIPAIDFLHPAVKLQDALGASCRLLACSFRHNV